MVVRKRINNTMETYFLRLWGSILTDGGKRLGASVLVLALLLLSTYVSCWCMSARLYEFGCAFCNVLCATCAYHAWCMHVACLLYAYCMYFGIWPYFSDVYNMRTTCIQKAYTGHTKGIQKAYKRHTKGIQTAHKRHVFLALAQQSFCVQFLCIPGFGMATFKLLLRDRFILHALCMPFARILCAYCILFFDLAWVPPKRMQHACRMHGQGVTLA